MAASADSPDLRPDWPLLRQAPAEVGIAASTRVWTDPGARWDDVDLVLANGAWDNIHRPEEFVAWVGRVAEVTPVANAPEVLRWNLDKRYLTALADAGVATVPTTWLTPGEPEIPLPPGQPGQFGQFGEFVVKPTVSGGGFETARYRTGGPTGCGAWTTARLPCWSSSSSTRRSSSRHTPRRPPGSPGCCAT